MHSAGIPGKNSRLEDASAATLREVIDVNLYGGLLGARAAVRRMSTAKGGPGGAIVLVSAAVFLVTVLATGIRRGGATTLLTGPGH